MAARERPGVLVADGDQARRGRVAALLAEAGIAVIAASDHAAALSAVERRRYDLAIVGAGLGDLAARLAAARPEMQIFPLDDIPLAAGEPRRFVGRVRERLLRAERCDPGEAELFIATAKIACLDRRRAAARAAGAYGLAADLRNEIAETAAHRRSLICA